MGSRKNYDEEYKAQAVKLANERFIRKNKPNLPCQMHEDMV